jgi:hypothetical protein
MMNRKSIINYLWSISSLLVPFRQRTVGSEIPAVRIHCASSSTPLVMAGENESSIDANESIAFLRAVGISRENFGKRYDVP